MVFCAPWRDLGLIPTEVGAVKFERTVKAQNKEQIDAIVPLTRGAESSQDKGGDPLVDDGVRLCAVFGVSPAWGYKRTSKDAEPPLPIYRLGRAIRSDPDRIAAYLSARERYPTDPTLKPFDGIARVNGKGKWILTRKRFKAGSVRLREDRGPAYWEGWYREDIISEAAKAVRRRRDVNLGSLKEVKTEKAALQELAVIPEPIKDAKHRPKKKMTFRGFIEKYRLLKLENKKGTTVHGYETNIRAHYLPEFGDLQLSDISIEAVQAFHNQKRLEGKAA